jgi:tripartite-type tricarboxylate transporter receptor subunit TctC
MLRRTLLGAASLLATLPRPALAQSFPARPVRIVVPFAAGGPTDVMARLVAEQLSGPLGQPVVVENVSGAGGNLGAAQVARAQPDGHTILFSTPGPLSINQFLFRNPGYDAATAFRPVANIATVPSALVVNPQVAARSVAELVAIMRATPGRLNYGSSGNGTTSHLTGELFLMLTGTRAQHVPYRGVAPLMQDLVAGNVQFGFPADLALVQSGQLRALAVTSRARVPGFPEIPTMIEAGLADFESVAWFCFVVPAATPETAVRRLNAEVNRALTDTELRRRFAVFGAAPAGGTPEDLAALIARETVQWRRVIEAANVSIQ